MKYSDTNEHLNDDQLENVNKNNEAPVDAAKKRVEEKSSIDPDLDPGQEPSDNSEQESQALKEERSDTPKEEIREEEEVSSQENTGEVKDSEEPANKVRSADEVAPQKPEAVKDPEKPSEDAYTEDEGDDSKETAEKIQSEQELPTQEKETEEKVVPQQAEEVKDPEDKSEEVQSAEEVAPQKPEAVKDPEEKSEKVASEEEDSSQKKNAEEKRTAVKVDTEKEVSSQKKDAEKEKESEKINYELLSKTDLVKLLEDLLNHKSFGEIRSSVDEIQEIYNRKQEAELTKKREKFIAEGGVEQDFKPAEDPVDRQMDELTERYKSLKADYGKQLEDAKETNLAAKQEVLEEFRLLMEKQEGFDNTFRKFKQLQKRWFDIGIVPRQNVRDLWNSYNFFVDKFNDYANISKELKVLDLKKNLEKKIELCNKAEALSNEPSITSAFKTLQTYHAQWREIGPVPREDKDVVWERFKSATSVINKSHQNFQAALKDSLFENLELKRGLCEKAEELAALELSHHKEWAEKTKVLLNIQKDWKSIGYAPKKENNKIYARFRKACDVFFKKKAAFYAATFEHQKEIVQQKKEIIDEAEKLMDSTDWKKTTDLLIGLQKQWKESGPLPKKESDKLWNRFRSACDHFFNKKSEFYGGKDESYEENLKSKESLIEEIKSCEPPASAGKLTAMMKDFQNRYDEIGFVPVEVKDKIRDDFRDVMNSLVDKLETDENTKALIQYRIKITTMLNSSKSDNKLRFERDKVMNKLTQLKNDIGVWENNIGFFKQTESAEGTISDFHEKIEDAHSRIELMENKIRIIDEYDVT